jgi:hypothetical protein
MRTESRTAAKKRGQLMTQLQDVVIKELSTRGSSATLLGIAHRMPLKTLEMWVTANEPIKNKYHEQEQ